MAIGTILLNMLKALPTLIKNLPTILLFIQEIRKWLRDLKEDKDAKERINLLREGMREARKNGDSSKIEDLFKKGF